MGREVRRVIPNWEHPKGDDGNYLPLFNESYREAAERWRKGLAEWEAGGRKAQREGTGNDYEYWDWDGGPPDERHYRPEWKPEEMTWFQMYETVSEGTPVTPAFATAEELVDYLVTNGTFWDQHRGVRGWTRKNAEAFVKAGWAPTLIMADGVIKTPRDMGDLKE